MLFSIVKKLQHFFTLGTLDTFIINILSKYEYVFVFLLNPQSIFRFERIQHILPQIKSLSFKSAMQ